MVLSTPEGADKPRKYPLMFKKSAVMVVNKIDLPPHVNFDLDVAVRDARVANPDLAVFPMSCMTGEGVDGWIDWVRQQVRAFKAA